ncbi:MAG: 50S ribosomal protein L10 [Candidatus Pacearchaeota archaeon]|nr:50S ribosomal protein L10 [Candidatus Pacearchaeota archaeon]
MVKKKTNAKENMKKEIPAEKIKAVSELVENIKKHRTTLIASIKGLPSSQFHEIKKNLRGKAIIKVVKKSAAIKSIDSVGKDSLEELKKLISADIALFFSNIEPFELSSLLTDNQSPTKAKAGDIAPEDINVEPGPTNLVPGPAISELSSVGLKVAVEGGKLAIKLPHTIVKKGEVIKDNVASVLAKLDIKPMKVGFEPIAAYDAVDNKVYVGIKIDKKKTLEELREMIGKALGFAVKIGYLTKETLPFYLGKAAREELALINLINSKSQESNVQLNAQEGK